MENHHVEFHSFHSKLLVTDQVACASAIVKEMVALTGKRRGGPESPWLWMLRRRLVVAGAYRDAESKLLGSVWERFQMIWPQVGLNP